MEKQTSPEVEGFILELYPHGHELPCYISAFNSTAETGFDGYSENKAEAIVFESREALLPLASIESEAISMDGDDEFSVFDGFRIIPFKGEPATQVVTREELEAALDTFEQ